MVRYTIDGNDAVEARIQSDMDRIRDDSLRALGERNVTALLLSGAFGRGEGGVFTDEKLERPWGSYEIYVITPNPASVRQRALQGTLADLAARLSTEFGVAVRFPRVIPAPRISILAYELDLMELKEGHRILYGPPNVLADMPYFDTTLVPMAEGARMLLDRGISMLLSRKRNGTPEPDVANLVQIIHRANRALGDAILFARRAYAPSYVERVEHFENCDLQGIANPDDVRDHYYAALHFELRPHLGLPEGVTGSQWLEATIAGFEQVHLWFEQKRLNRRGMTWQEYMNLPSRLPAQPPRERMANIKQNVKAYGWPVLKEMARAARDPHDELMAMLPRVLYRNEGDPVEAEFMRLWGLLNNRS